MDARAAGDFLWGGVLSEAVACAVLHRISRSPLLPLEERGLYRRFAAEEHRHGMLLRDAALQYTGRASRASLDRIRTFDVRALGDHEVLALVLAGERISSLGFDRIIRVFTAAGDPVTVAAYRQITKDEPAHIEASQAVLHRIGDPRMRRAIRRMTEAAMGSYREACVDRQWLTAAPAR